MKTHRWIFLFMIGLLIAGCQQNATLSPASSLPQGANATTVVPANTQYPAMETQPAETLPANSTGGYPYPNPMNPTPSSPDASSMNSTPGADPWSAYPAATEDAGFRRGKFFVDSVAVQPVSGQAGQFDLVVAGSLPTPCNKPRAKVTPPSADKKIVVDLYTVLDPNMMCTQVIKPFEGKVATFKDIPAGKYTVVVNDQPAVEMTIP